MKTRTIQVDGVKVETISAEIVSANIIEVEVGTTGHCGGDTGHGGRTYFRIKDLASTDMNAKITGESCGNAGEVEISFGGDCELDTFIQALEFALTVLKNQSQTSRAL